MTRTWTLRRFGVAAAAAALLLAACGGGEETTPAETTPVETTPAETEAPAASTIEVNGTDQLRFEPDQFTVAAGEVTVTLTSTGAAPHNFTIEELGDLEVVAVDGGQTASGTVTLEPGTYTFYCSVPGHREAGMEGTITVTG